MTSLLCYVVKMNGLRCDQLDLAINLTCRDVWRVAVTSLKFHTHWIDVLLLVLVSGQERVGKLAVSGSGLEAFEAAALRSEARRQFNLNLQSTIVWFSVAPNQMR